MVVRKMAEAEAEFAHIGPHQSGGTKSDFWGLSRRGKLQEQLVFVGCLVWSMEEMRSVSVLLFLKKGSLPIHKDGLRELSCECICSQRIAMYKLQSALDMCHVFVGNWI